MQFEKARLDLFARYGVEMEPFRVGTTYGLRRGPRHEVPLVFVHGGLAEASNWAPLVSRLADRHVICLDRPGCGLTETIDYTAYDSDAYRRHAAEWLASVVNGLELDEIDLVGNSMGGFFSLCFALAHPDRVRRLVFTGAPAGLDRRLPFFLRLMASPLARWIARPIEDPATLRKRVFAPMLLADASRVSDAQLEVSILSNQIPGTDVAARTMLRTVATPWGWRKDLFMRERAKALQVPTLFLWGDRDAFASADSGREVAAALGELGQLRVIEDAGHLPSLDQPEVVAAEIRRFTQSLSRPVTAVQQAC